MSFDVLPPEIVLSAKRLKKHLRSIHMKKIREDIPPPNFLDAPWRPTIVAQNEDQVVSFDIRQDAKFEPAAFMKFILFANLNKIDIEINLAIHMESSDYKLAGSFLQEIKRSGIGLWIIEPNKITELERAISCAIKYKPSEDELNAGKHTNKLKSIAQKSQIDWIDPLREITIHFEKIIGDIGRLAIKKKYSVILEKDFSKFDLDKKIRHLGDINKFSFSGGAIIESKLLIDCLAFKDNARNTSHHPIKTKKDERALRLAANERMQSGFRLIRTLAAIESSL